jgi:hypothetical protein
MYVCYTNGSCPTFQSQSGVIEKTSKVGFLKNRETMSKKNHNRNRWLNTRLTEVEFKSIKRRFENSTFLKMSEYSRCVLLEKTVKVKLRNQSMDELMEELILLRKELNFIGHNFNQAVRILNSKGDDSDARDWQRTLDISRNQLEPCIKKIKEKINDYAELWSQKLSVEKV